MFRMFFRFVSSESQQPAKLPITPTQTSPVQTSVQPCHRDRLLSMRIEHTQICSQTRCELLKEVGIVRAGDLLTCDLKQLTSANAPLKAIRLVRRYRQVIRLACSVPGMMPRDAQLLISVHRRSIQGIAMESPAALHRDLVRFSLSSKGRRLIRGRRLPSVRRLRKYVTACKSAIAATNALMAERSREASVMMMPKAA